MTSGALNHRRQSYGGRSSDVVFLSSSSAGRHSDTAEPLCREKTSSIFVFLNTKHPFSCPYLPPNSRWVCFFRALKGPPYHACANQPHQTNRRSRFHGSLHVRGQGASHQRAHACPAAPLPGAEGSRHSFPAYAYAEARGARASFSGAKQHRHHHRCRRRRRCRNCPRRAAERRFVECGDRAVAGTRRLLGLRQPGARPAAFCGRPRVEHNTNAQCPRP